jgi:hypothetical protein
MHHFPQIIIPKSIKRRTIFRMITQVLMDHHHDMLPEMAHALALPIVSQVDNRAYARWEPLIVSPQTITHWRANHAACARRDRSSDIFFGSVVLISPIQQAKKVTSVKLGEPIAERTRERLAVLPRSRRCRLHPYAVPKG